MTAGDTNRLAKQLKNIVTFWQSEPQVRKLLRKQTSSLTVNKWRMLDSKYEIGL